MSKRTESSGCPAWMMTFGDCMSLLVTFFVMLIAFTNLEEGKFMELIGAMQGALGVTARPYVPATIAPRESPNIIRGLQEDIRWLTLDELSAVIPDAENALRRFGSPRPGFPESFVTVRLLEDGLSFVIVAAACFEEGRATLQPDSGELWRQLGGFLGQFANEIRVVGVVRTGAPVGVPGVRTPAELGMERARAVRVALQQAARIPASRFSVSGKEEPPGITPSVSGRVLPADRLEIILIARRRYRALRPQDVILREGW